MTAGPVRNIAPYALKRIFLWWFVAFGGSIKVNRIVDAMKIVVAPDSFKGSVTAGEACAAIGRGVVRVVPGAEIVLVPLADGGEGTAEALVASTKGQLRKVKVHGPLDSEVEAKYGILGGGTAVIEMAQAAGLPLVPSARRNPLYTTTYGLGQLILDALEQDCRDFIIGIGGSATNDCGCGMAQALGVRFIDKAGHEIGEPMTGELAGKVGKIDCSKVSAAVAQSRFTVACDVDNPLLGPTGASYVYSPQKGADDETVKLLEANMTHIIELIESAAGKSVRNSPGAGAAGGLGAGLLAFLNGRLERGIDIVMRYSRFDQIIRRADLIITGEGRIDRSTAFGKTIAGVAAAAKRQSIPVIALAGSLADDTAELHKMGVSALMSICPGPMSAEQAMEQGSQLLSDAAERALRLAVMNLTAEND